MRQLLNTGTLLGLAVILVIGGCATTGSGASDDDQIRGLLGEWQEAILAKEVDRYMATHSESFSHDGYEYQADDKAGLRDFTEGAIAEGGWDDVELYMEDMDIAIAEGKATVYPIDYTVPAGTITIELILTKEKAGWLITDMNIEGL